MANVKRIRIIGFLPYYVGQHEGDALIPFLAAMNGPTFGIRIRWPKGDPSHEKYVANDHGGRTCLCRFVIEGEEAVSELWVGSLCQAILTHKGAGSEYSITEFIDVDHNVSILTPFTKKNG